MGDAWNTYLSQLNEMQQESIRQAMIEQSQWIQQSRYYDLQPSDRQTSHKSREQPWDMIKE